LPLRPLKPPSHEQHLTRGCGGAKLAPIGYGRVYSADKVHIVPMLSGRLYDQTCRPAAATAPINYPRNMGSISVFMKHGHHKVEHFRFCPNSCRHAMLLSCSAAAVADPHLSREFSSRTFYHVPMQENVGDCKLERKCQRKRQQVP
jgi:hypothetical protein